MKVINKIKYFSVLLVFLSMLGSNANADVVYSTFGSGQTYDDDASYNLGTSMEQKLAVSFTPTNDFENITFTFAASNSNIDQLSEVTIALTTGDSIPDSSPAIETKSTNVTSDLNALYTVSFASDISMGTKYWVILTAETDPGSLIKWYLSDAVFGNIAFDTNKITPDWFALAPTVKTTAFEVAGDIKTTPVPEPAALLLFCSGLVGLFAGRRMFKQ